MSLAKTTKPTNGKLSNRQFTFMMFNYIVGFGFISTIGQVIKLGGWGVFVFFSIAFVAFGVMLLFSRLAANFPQTEGSSYGFAKLTHGHFITFGQGWNQYVQGPVLGVTVPLFLESVLKQQFPDLSLLWKFLSIGIYVLFIFISVFPLNKTIRYIQYFATAKWLILVLVFILAFILTVRDNGYHSNWLTSDKATISSVTGAMLAFVYAFGGIEGITTLIKDTDGKSIKKNFFLTFIGIVTFYFVVFIILFGLGLDKRHIDISKVDLVKEIYNISFGVTGVVLFTIGIIANKASAIISSSVINAKSIAPLAIDNYLPSWIGKKSKDGVYRNATYLSAGISLFMMALFQLINAFINPENPFLSVLEIGTIAFFVQYFMTAVTIFKLNFQKRITIPVWERVIIATMMLAIIFILLTQMIPPITNDKFTTKTIVMDVAYFSFMGVGYGLWGLTKHFGKPKQVKA